MQCPGQNFALNEAAFMLVRLLQRFSRFELVPEAIPEGARPPPQWKEGKGRQRIEQVWPSTAFTAFVKVSVLSAFLLLLLLRCLADEVRVQGGLWVRPVAA